MKKRLINERIIPRKLQRVFSDKGTLKKDLKDIAYRVFNSHTNMIIKQMNDYIVPKKWFDMSHIINRNHITSTEVNGVGDVDNTEVMVVFSRNEPPPLTVPQSLLLARTVMV